MTAFISRPGYNFIKMSLDVGNSTDEESNVVGSRRPMNAFLLFCKRHRSIVKDKYPNLENRNITKILGEWWQSLSDGEKADFNNLAAEYKEHVMREQPNFRWRKPPTTVNANTHYTKSQSATAAHSNSKSSVPGTSGFGEKNEKRKGALTSPSESSIHSDGCSKNIGKADRDPSSVNAANGVSLSTSSSNRSSCSSSPEPTEAPKPFKKRFLASFDHSSPKSDSRVSPDAESACKALLELAGVRESSPALPSTSSQMASSETADAQKSRSGSATPPEEAGMSGHQRNGGKQGFNTLRDAVWGRVARTLLKQEEEKGSSKSSGEDAPLNLSSQCTIRGQTIIEHIIENILDMPRNEEDARKEKGSPHVSNINNNRSIPVGGNANGGVSGEETNNETAEQIKERIYQGLKQDILKRPPGVKDKDCTALWKVLPHSNISMPKSNDNSKQANNKPSTTSASLNGAPVSPKAVNANSLSVNVTRVASKANTSPPIQITAVKETVTSKKPEGTPSSGDDGSKLDIKHLLAQSPAPLSPRSKTTCPSTVSLTNAVIASVLQEEQPLKLFMPAHHQEQLGEKGHPPVSVTLISTDNTKQNVASKGINSKPWNLSSQTVSRTPSVSLIPVKGSETNDTMTQQTMIPSTAAVTITATSSGLKRKSSTMSEDEEEEDLRRSSRSCKGRRYQELKDEGCLGRRRRSSSGSSKRTQSIGEGQDEQQNQHDSTKQLCLTTEDAKLSSTNAVNTQQPRAPSTFDVSARLNEIPALSLEAYQERIKNQH